MCGIAGAAAIQGVLDPAIAASLQAMTDVIAHRGPDAQGHRRGPGYVLGHRRLAIIDLSGGAQPMCNEDGTVWIVFNGEVYNHHDLRATLQAKGHVFRTRSDTEAIVHAWEEFGVDCCQHLEGMFAFAIYDERKKELFLARDRLGKKPVFYAALGGALHFASEIKSIRQSPAWNGELDMGNLESYLSLSYFMAPGSVYRDVRKLMPGHWLHLKDGRIETRSYWDIAEFDTDLRDESAIVADLEDLLRRMVFDRLESEVPLGAFLSGGIDSGLMVSFMHERKGDAMNASTVGFADAGESRFNEIPAATATAKHYKLKHYIETIDPKLDEVFDKVIDGFDEPFGDDSAIPTYYVSRITRKHVTVAMSGDGGDEAFGGYDFRYVPHAIECRLRKLVPGAPGRALLSLLGRLWPRWAFLPKPLRLATIFENLALAPEDAYYLDMCFIKPSDARALMGQAPDRDPRKSPVYAAVVEPYLRCPSKSFVQKAEYGDLKTYLPNCPLVKVDRMSMQNSLEVRCPLLDRRVAEFAFRVPQDRKLPNLKPKHLLKQVAKRRLPEEVLSLPKQGFSMPLGKWFRGPYAAPFRDEVLGPSSRIGSLLDAKLIRKHFDAHVAGQEHRGSELWQLWVLERWLRKEASLAQ